MVSYTLLRTALDPLLAVAGPAGLARLEFLPRAWEYHTLAHAAARHQYGQDVAVKEDDGAFGRLRDELAEYFVGERREFTIELDPCGTDFDRRVWQQLQKIPYGKLRTYGEVARALRKPTATRAVGQAAGRNPLPILIPCHRVVGRGGSLVGFAGGIDTKARLLRLEGHTLGDSTRGDTTRIEEPRLF
ncbi:MAG: methylated-DNA--[protein]-cysteine S-methyltransferase [bacterium]|nr:methylated-DNA--[protein]-cysteine S-methyltransferase [bacterium]